MVDIKEEKNKGSLLKVLEKDFYRLLKQNMMAFKNRR